MPTFKQDIKLGTDVPQMKTDDYNDKSVTEEKLADGAVTADKLSPEVRSLIVDGDVLYGMHPIEENEIDNIWETKKDTTTI